MCGELLRLLEPHNKVEEQALFLAMREEYPDHVNVLLGEHALVHAVLLDVEAGSPAGDWRHRLGEALHTLREHIAKEQDGLFPAALSTLTTDQWETAERVRAEVGSPLVGLSGTFAGGAQVRPTPGPASGAAVGGTGALR